MIFCLFEEAVINLNVCTLQISYRFVNKHSKFTFLWENLFRHATKHTFLTTEYTAEKSGGAGF